jgi:hypothetical protein
MTTHQDMVFALGGVPLLPGIPFGKNSKVFFVDQLNGSDGQRGDKPSRALATLSKAHSLMTSNRNDVAIVIGSVTGTNANIASGSGSSIGVREGATLAWSKDQCHIVGLAYNRVSQRVSIRSDGTEFTPLVNVTGDGCVFANIHAFHGYDDDSAQICWVDGGERNAYYNVHFGGMGNQTAADHVGGRSLTITGTGLGENYFKDCVIGLDTVTRGAANSSLLISGGSTRNIFENCIFPAHLDSADALFVTIGALGIDRFVLFDNCVFNSMGTTMTQGMSINASPGGNVLLKDCMLVGATEYDAGDTAFTNNPAAAATGGVGIAVADS